MRQWTIDAFASGPFRGNPACVVEPFDAWPEAAWMQALAAENNQAETAFLLKSDEPGRFGLRWFTPTVEVPLCGHATLASAHALYAELGATSEAIVFDTLSGPLIVTRAGDGYRMDFPADPPRPVATPKGLAEALGAEPVEVLAGQYLVVLLASEAEVLELKPDLPALASAGAGLIPRPGCLSVAALADVCSPYEVVSRFFAPGAGIPEDPATGSAHCLLAPLFAERLGRRTLSFHQAYPGRGGDLECEAAGERVLLAGRAVTVIESRLRL